MKTKILFLAVLLLLSSCTSFNVVSVSPYSAKSIRQYENEGKYLVLHRENDAWHMYDLEIINDSINAKLDYYLGYHANYLNPDKKGRNMYSKSREPDVTNAIHVYTSDSSFSSFDTLISIPVSSIHEVNQYTFNKAAFITSIILPVILIPVGIFMIVGMSQLGSMDLSIGI